MSPDIPPPVIQREGDRALGPPVEPGWRNLLVMRNAAVFIAVVTGGFVIKSLQGIVTPLVVAAFLLLLIDGFSRAVARRLPGWPEWLRITLAAVLIVAGFAAIVGVIHYGRPFASELGVLEPKLDALIAAINDRLGLEPISFRDLLQRESPTGAVGRAVGAARKILSGALLTLIYLGFLLASRQAFSRKMRRLFGGPERRAHAKRVFDRVRSAAEAYAGLQTIKAALMAVAGFLIMAGFGLHNAVFLAFLIFLTAYIPILGGLMGVVLPTLLAFAQFGEPLRAPLLLALLALAAFLIESVLMPKLQSDRLNLDPVSILLALGFWGVLLGVPGALLSTPLAVVVMAVASEFEGAQWLAILLSKEGEPTDD